MRFWIDTEFNEYKGQLISMALVGDDGSEWYEVLQCENPGPWVARHVMPILFKEPLANAAELAESLRKFLQPYSVAHIVADWPEDIAFFCNALITGPGERIGTPRLTFEIIRDLPNTADMSVIPHNALEDARALQRSSVRTV